MACHLEMRRPFAGSSVDSSGSAFGPSAHPLAFPFDQASAPSAPFDRPLEIGHVVSYGRSRREEGTWPCQAVVVGIVGDSEKQSALFVAD